MIKAILVFNNHGKPRVMKFYQYYVSISYLKWKGRGWLLSSISLIILIHLQHVFCGHGLVWLLLVFAALSAVGRNLLHVQLRYRSLWSLLYWCNGKNKQFHTEWTMCVDIVKYYVFTVHTLPLHLWWKVLICIHLHRGHTNSDTDHAESIAKSIQQVSNTQNAFALLMFESAIFMQYGGWGGDNEYHSCMYFKCIYFCFTCLWMCNWLF